MQTDEELRNSGFDEYAGSDGNPACLIKASGFRIMYRKLDHPDADTVLNNMKSSFKSSGVKMKFVLVK